MRFKLEPVSEEKHLLLEKYVRQWRWAYRKGVLVSNWVADHDKRLVIYYYKHRTHLGMSMEEYKARELRKLFTYARRKAREEAPDIHSLAFQQAWWKGIQNRQTHPYAYAKMALIPWKLAHFEDGFLCFRLYPQVDLLFENCATTLEGQALMLLQRKTGWYLK